MGNFRDMIIDKVELITIGHKSHFINKEEEGKEGM